MEVLHCHNSADLFDELVHKSLAQASDITIAAKPNCTKGGRMAVVITFNAQMPDGTVRRVQAVTTARLLITAAAALSGWSGESPTSTAAPARN